MLKNISLEERKRSFDECASNYKSRIVICAGTACVAGGALDVYARFTDYMKEKGIRVSVTLEKESGDTGISQSGCQGFCQMGPLVTIYPRGILYTKVKPSDVEEIVDETLLGGKLIERLLYHNPRDNKTYDDIAHIPFYARQRRTVLRMCGNIDAQDIDEYIANGGYMMARRAVLTMGIEEICAEQCKKGPNLIVNGEEIHHCTIEKAVEAIERII